MNGKVITALASALFFLTVSLATPVMADISASIEASLGKDGVLTVTGTSEVDDFEAKLVRLAIDSPLNLPDFGLLGTGNGDGQVNATEVLAYASKTMSTGLVSKAFDKGFIKVHQDGKSLPATLRSIDLSEAVGNTSSPDGFEVTFVTTFELDLDEDKESTVLAMVLTFNNITYDIGLEVPDGWDIGTIDGLKGPKVVNDDEGSSVSGKGTGDGTPVHVEVKKEGDVCCLLLVIGIIVLVVIIIFVYRRHRKKKEVQRSLAQPEYHLAPGAKPLEPSTEEGGSVRRISDDDRTFGKDYFSKDEKKE